MKDTCNFEGCYFAGLLDSPAQCPNYMENWFYPHNKDPHMVKDCAPKRTLELLKDVHMQMMRVQKSSEQERNKFDTMVRMIASSPKNIEPDIKQVTEGEYETN